MNNRAAPVNAAGNPPPPPVYPEPVCSAPDCGRAAVFIGGPAGGYGRWYACGNPAHIARLVDPLPLVAR